MRRIVTAFLILRFVQPIPARAQDSGSLRSGDEVRVTAPDCSLHGERGLYRGKLGNHLLLSFQLNRVSCPISAITRIEIHRGRRSVWKPALIGAGVMGLAGAASASQVRACYAEFDEKTNYCPVIGAGIGIGTGLFLGIAFASIRGRDVWEELSLPSVSTAVFRSMGNRLHLQFSITLGR